MLHLVFPGPDPPSGRRFSRCAEDKSGVFAKNNLPDFPPPRISVSRPRKEDPMGETAARLLPWPGGGDPGNHSEGSPGDPLVPFPSRGMERPAASAPPQAGKTLPTGGAPHSIYNKRCRFALFPLPPCQFEQCCRPGGKSISAVFAFTSLKRHATIIGTTFYCAKAHGNITVRRIRNWHGN